MKKILSILILTILVIVLVAPSGALAQKEKLKECCVIRQDIKWESGTICMEVDSDHIDCTTLQVCTKNDPCVLTALDANKFPQGIGPKASTACPGVGDPTNIADDFVAYASDNQWGMVCIINTITFITDWIFYIMIIAVVIVFVIAGAWFMLAGGDVEKTGKAKGLMILGVVGLAIALLAKLIPSIVKLIVGM